ncbi:MAG: ral secretion pathway protein [Pseudomonadota bacterium]|nr:ral secretion pathway protein [Pseudomonadota bacterium]
MERKSNAQQSTFPPLQRGFTLIELLVVVSIIAIAFSAFIMLGFSFSNPEDALRTEVQRLHARLQFAHEQGVMRGEDYGVRFHPQGYRLMRYENGKWADLDTDKLLLPHTLPENMRLDLALEGISAIVTEPDAELKKNPEHEIRPQVFLLSSGETTPDFEVRIRISGADLSRAVHGNINGQYELVKD